MYALVSRPGAGAAGAGAGAGAAAFLRAVLALALLALALLALALRALAVLAVAGSPDVAVQPLLGVRAEGKACPPVTRRSALRRQLN
jgi:hypothetical protein